MPTYALLGATGATGSAILRSLLQKPPEPFTLNVFVRSKSKLLKAFPDLENAAAFKITIIEGLPTDITAMRECLKGVDVVMGCIASNYNTPGMSVVYDTAAAIIAALEYHQQEQGPAYITPTVVQLRSASLNPIYKAAVPWFVQKVCAFCFYYIYADLDRACNLLASSAADSPGLLDYIIIDPPSIHDADGTKATGHKLILDEELKSELKSELNYADLGVAFCEAAERKNELKGKAVGVTATGTVYQTWGTLIGYIVSGAKASIFG